MIEALDLHKTFTSGFGRSKRRIAAVEGVSLSAQDGSVTGLLGPNGAGKTTSLRMIATLVVPDRGSARVDGLDSVTNALQVRQVLGVLSDARGLYSRLTTRENIRYYGRLRGMPDASIDESLLRLSDLIEMGGLLDRRTEGFSQGERMKVAIARALIHDPKNLVLDEPTNGLDIVSTRALRELIRRLKDAGKCILISSHIMQEISALADQIFIVAEGHSVASGTAQELQERAGAQNLEDAFVSLTTPAVTAAEPGIESGDTLPFAIEEPVEVVEKPVPAEPDAPGDPAP
ncbi:MAG: ATP-binding cassette domain-containing protein [Burkholderiaceae bacterium]|jgi:sodium transport system ATP-binding protein